MQTKHIGLHGRRMSGKVNRFPFLMFCVQLLSSFLFPTKSFLFKEILKKKKIVSIRFNCFVIHPFLNLNFRQLCDSRANEEYSSPLLTWIRLCLISNPVTTFGLDEEQPFAVTVALACLQAGGIWSSSAVTLGITPSQPFSSSFFFFYRGSHATAERLAGLWGARSEILSVPQAFSTAPHTRSTQRLLPVIYHHFSFSVLWNSQSMIEGSPPHSSHGNGWQPMVFIVLYV